VHLPGQLAGLLEDGLVFRLGELVVQSGHVHPLRDARRAAGPLVVTVLVVVAVVVAVVVGVVEQRARARPRSVPAGGVLAGRVLEDLRELPGFEVVALAERVGEVGLAAVRPVGDVLVQPRRVPVGAEHGGEGEVVGEVAGVGLRVAADRAGVARGHGRMVVGQPQKVG
jgi:hypothetical protein